MAHGKIPVDWAKYRAEFPVTERYVYFNHAAVSPLSTSVIGAIEALNRDLLMEGYLCIERAFERVQEVRGAAAELMGAEACEIAFTKNTSQGVLIAANGIRWRPGDNVVIPSKEFPANYYPWLALGSKGVKLKTVEEDRGKVTAEMLADACDDRTRAVTVSFVQFADGYRTDLGQLGGFCRDRGIYLHVDGIQALGMLQFDVHDLKIDFLSSGGYKWLLAQPGTGLFYIRKEILDEIDVWNTGWTSMTDHMDFTRYSMRLRGDAGRFEEGSMNMHGIFALGASIDRFLEIGMDEVEGRIISLTASLEKGLAGLGCTITSHRGKGEQSGIISFAHPKRSTGELFDALSGAGVVCTPREGSIRLSPHFYNNGEEVSKLLEVLKR